MPGSSPRGRMCAALRCERRAGRAVVEATDYCAKLESDSLGVWPAAAPMAKSLRPAEALIIALILGAVVVDYVLSKFPGRAPRSTE